MKNASAKETKNRKKMKHKNINKSININLQKVIHQHHTEAGAHPDGHHHKHHRLYQPINAENLNAEENNHLNDAEETHQTIANANHPNAVDEIHQNIADLNHLNVADMNLNAVAKYHHHRGASAHTSHLQGQFANQDQEQIMTKHHQDHIHHISTSPNYPSTTRKTCQIQTSFVTPS
jgi:hypothetical protein